MLVYKAKQFPFQEQQYKQKEHLLRKEKARDYKAAINAQAGTDPSTAAPASISRKLLSVLMVKHPASTIRESWWYIISHFTIWFHKM